MLECSSRSLNIQLTYVTYLKYICESEFDLRESPDWLSQRKKGNLGQSTCRDIDMSVDCFDPCARRYVV